MVSSETLKLNTLFKKINDEFENLETFIESDNDKTERFKSYIKQFYDYLKTQDNDSDSVQLATSTIGLPELIIDKNLVDLEQIYQQLQLYNQNNNESNSSIQSFTKFFSKCLVNLESLSFNIDNNNTNCLSNEDSVDAEADEEAEEDDYDDDDDQQQGEEDDEDETHSDNDSIDNLIQTSKKKLTDKNKNSTNFGIPDGSDSEISDFEVEENGEGEEEEDDDDDDDDVEDEDEDEDNNEKGDEENKNDIDSDEVDDDLVDLYQDLGDEKEVLGIGKPTKAFEQVDFDREDFGLQDDEEEEEEEQKESKQSKNKDLFDQDNKKQPETKNKSSFELRQEKVKEQMEEIHESMIKNLVDKPWQLSGEASAKTRPKESLLEEYLQFEHTTKQAPVIDASTTEQLEKMIKQRIKDKAFDDVERKVKPVEMQYEYKKQVVLDNEKSKQGLGEVYEQEYLKQQQKELNNELDKPKEEANNPKNEEIRKRLQSLFIKLDALSNFHFTPKAPVPELKVVSNMPTINMEEVAPVNVADSNVLAPEEIKSKINSLPKSKSEENKSDKNRNLRVKKLISKKRKQEREKRLQMAQALDPNNDKVKKEIAMNKLKKQAKNLSKNIKILKHEKSDKESQKALKSSTAFFKQLQENTINKKTIKKKQNDSAESNKSSKKLKL